MFKYWKTRKIEWPEGYIWIFCPEMENNHSIGTIRKGYREFKRFEAYLKKKYTGWVACTGLENIHIMEIMRKIGADPFEINEQEKKLWFIKNLMEV